MSLSPLGSYLNDHLAGSVAAIEMLDHLIAAHDSTPLRPFFASLRTEIQADQDTLKQIIAAAGAGESVTRQAVAWTMEKVTRIKFDFADLHGYGLLQALEALLLGISGKRALWEALASLPMLPSALRAFQFTALIERAEAQARSVDRKRVTIAAEVLCPTQALGAA